MAEIIMSLYTVWHNDLSQKGKENLLPHLCLTHTCLCANLDHCCQHGGWDL